MKSFIKFLGALSFWELCGRHPAIAGVLMLLGIGGGAGIALLTTPTIVPQGGSYFNMNQVIGDTSNALKPNNGTAGSFLLPGSPANSFVIYVEGLTDPNLPGVVDGDEFALGIGSAAQGLIVSGYGPGQPQFLVQKFLGGAYFWNAVSSATYGTSASASGTQTSYNTGYYPFTTSGGGCARQPTGVFVPGGGVDIVDPGFLCDTAPFINPVTIPGDGASQATGAGSTATTCAVVSGQAVVTAHVAVAHGVVPGAAYAMAGFTPSGFNALITAPYTALPGTAGTTLVGTTGATSCPSPATATVEGTALSGTTAAITWPAISTIAPLGSESGQTGVTAYGAQHFCAAIIGYGADSPFPGAQAFSAVDDNGNPLPGAPALVPWLNQGTANFTGYTTTTTQDVNFNFTASFSGSVMTVTGSPGGTLAVGQTITGANLPGGVTISSLQSGTTGGAGTYNMSASFTIASGTYTAHTYTPALTVTAMNAYTITGATYAAASGSTPAEVTFALSSSPGSPGFIAGSEFTVSGIAPSGYNQTYVAVAGTSGLTIVGNPLSGPVGTPRALSNPGAYSSGGSMVSVILPAMQPLGASGTGVSSYGTFGSTGTGGVGTYGLWGTPAPYQFSATGTSGASQITVAGAVSTSLVVGQAISGTGVASGTIISSLGTGTGGSGTYKISIPLTGTVSGTNNIQAAGTIGSSAAPVSIFASANVYYTAAAGPPPSGGTVTPRSQASIGEFVNVIGNEGTTIGRGPLGWGGALGNVAMLYTPGGFPTQSGGAPSTTSLASLCKKQADLQTFAATNGFTVHSLYRLNDPGIWADSSIASFTGSISGTALTVIGSPQYGSLPTVTAGSPSVTIAGAGIAGCPLSCPTISSGSGSSYTLSASGGTVASETMTAGAYKPATPTASNSFNGYISGNTLTMTSIGTGSGYAAFTGSLGTSFTGSISTAGVLTVTAPVNGAAVLGIGTTITGAGVPSGEVVTSFGTGFGISGTYNVSPAPTVAVASEAMIGAGTLAGQASTLVVNSGTTPSGGTTVTDGGASITGPPLLVTSCNGTVCAIAPTYYPAISNDSTMVGTFTLLLPGQYVQSASGVSPSVATPVKILSYQGACGITGAYNGGPGCYALSNSANSVGSSGSPVAFISTSISDGGAIAPGPALTIKDLGPGVTFPVTSYGSGSFGSYSSGTGALFLSGTFDTSVLGGAPSTIQAQVSTTAGGPPISGCAACAWTALSSYSKTPLTFTASITTGGTMTVPIGAPQPSVGNAFTGAGYSGTVTASAGAGTFTVSPPPGSAITAATMTASTVFNWSGQALSIPAGGPYYVSVRAANGTAYATMPNLIKVGLIFNLWGEGQLGSLLNSVGGYGLSYFNGLWGSNQWQGSLDTGPPVAGSYAPAQTVMIAGDRYGVSGASSPILAEGIGNFEQGLASAFGWPVGIVNGERDGIDATPLTLGHVVQTQTVGVGNGSATTWCSAATFCAEPANGVQTTLFFTAASMTGASLVNATISGNTLSVPAGSGTPTTTGLTIGALEPGLVLNVAGSPTLTTCLTGCTSGAYGDPPAAQSWALSASASGTPTRADPPGGAPWPSHNIQIGGAPLYGPGGGFGQSLVQAGTFTITVNGTVVCQDTQIFAYNNQGGNCTTVTNTLGLSIASSFVNYQTGDYSITFAAAPANDAVITASWTNIITPDSTVSVFSKPQGLDYFGNGSCTSGPESSLFCKTPGGVSGHVFVGSTLGTMFNMGYPIGAVGYTQMISWLYGVRFPDTIPGVSASTPFISAGFWRGTGAIYFITAASVQCCSAYASAQWYQDVVTKSTFSGTISGSVLTLSANAVGPMWEGEIISGAGLSGGIDITGLTGGSWGASGSTYALGGASGVSFTGAMQNAVYYQGAGPAIYAGALNDDVTQAGSDVPGGTVALGYAPHPGTGFAGGRRLGSRLGCLVWGGLTNPANCSSPTIDRTKADASGCDTAALAAPCLDIGNTYEASFSTATWTGATVTISGGLAAHARPFVDGQAISCSGCNTGLYITSVSAPPTQDTRLNSITGNPQGQVGNTFTFTANAAIGGTGSGAITAGCSGTSGVGSNCIDIAIKAGTTNGTWATPFALATCGANNINGTAYGYNVPNGVCQDSGIGSLVRSFRIGTQQYILSSSPSLPFDDGVDQLTSGGFNQSGAFTCNIVASQVGSGHAGVVQCVKNAAYAAGIPVSAGLWTALTWPSASIASATYNSATGILSLTFAAAPFGASVGSTLDGAQVTISAIAGTGSVSSLKGQWVITSTGSAGTVINLGAPVGLGTISITSGTIAAGNGTFMQYGDANIGVTRYGSLMGYVGGQSFPITTAGSGYTNGTYTISLTGCTVASGGYLPKMDVSVSGGAIVDAYPSTAADALGLGMAAGCSIPISALGAGTGGAIQVIPTAPVEGIGGIANFNTDNNLMGVLMYGNEGEVGNPLNSFFTNGQGGYFEPGVPVQPWGDFLGAAVSG
jgi:hypothetical protein